MAQEIRKNISLGEFGAHSKSKQDVKIAAEGSLLFLILHISN